MPFLQHQLEMQLPKPSKIQHLALSKFIDINSIYLGPLIKCFLKSLFLIICRSSVTICFCCLSAKGELFYLNDKLLILL